MRNTRLFVLLCAVFVVLALLLYFTDDRRRPGGVSEKSLASGLSPDQIAKIILREGSDEVSLEVDADRWVVPSRSGYPAATDKIRALLLRLLSLRVSQAIADGEEHFTKFGVSDAAVQSGRMRISFQDTKGSELAGFYLGETRRVRAADPTQLGGGGQYVRKADDSTVFLIPEALAFAVDPAQWIRPSLLAISEERVIRVRQLTLTPEPTIEYVIERGDPGTAQDYRFADGTKPDVASVSPVVSGLENVRIEDVTKLEEPAGSPAEGEQVYDRRTVYELENGQRVTVDTVSEGEKLFGRFSVEFDPLLVQEAQERYRRANERRSAASQLTKDDPADTNGSDSEEAKSASETEQVTTTPSLPPLVPPKEATREETEELNRSLAAWSYQLPSFHSERYRKSKEDLTARN